MKTHSRSPRTGSVGLALALSIIMLGSAAIASVGFAVPASSPLVVGSELSAGIISASSSGTTIAGPSYNSPTILSNPVVFQGETSTLTMTIPSSGTAPYAWQWLYSTNGGESYRAATSVQCAAPGGSGASAGETETCSFATSGSTPVGGYLFELKVTDSATTPETQISSPSATVTVDAAVTAADAPPDDELAPALLSPFSVTPTVAKAPSPSMPRGLLEPAAPLSRASAPIRAPGAPPVLDGESTDSCASCAAGVWFTPAVSASSPNELLVLVITDYGEVSGPLTAADISDSGASHWVLATNDNWSGPGQVQYVFWAIDPDGGADSVSVDTASTATSASGATAIVFAVKNVNTASPIDRIGSFANGVSLAPSASVTTDVADDLVVGILSTTNGTAVSPTSSFTQIASVSDSVYTESYAEEGTAPTTGTYTSAPALSASVPWGEEAVAIAEVLSAGTASSTVNPVDVGQATTISTNGATGGTGGYTYSWTGLPTGCSSANPSFTCTPAEDFASPYTVTLTVTDSIGDRASTSFTLTVDSNPTVSVSPAGPLIYDEGQTSLRLTATVSYTGPNTASVEWYRSTSLPCNASSTDTHTSGSTFTPNTGVIGTRYFCAVVSDSGVPGYTSPSNPVEVVVNSALIAPGAPTITSNPVVDQGQTSALTATLTNNGTAPYAWQWLYSTNGGSSYAPATSSVCATTGGSGASGGAVETCSFSTTGSTPTGSYLFELEVTDSASTPETLTSAASQPVTVNTALTTPAAPTPGEPKMDVNQALTVTGTIPSSGSPTYSWQWLIEVNGAGGYVTATQCGASASGSGAAAGAFETCTIPGGTLTTGDSYTFEFLVTDSATAPEAAISAVSSTVTVSSSLTAPTPPTTGAAKLDANQLLTVTGTIPSTGTASYSWQWLVEVNGAGGYVDATQCGASESGTGATGGAVETCTIPGGTLTAGDSYTFEFQVTDSATTHETSASAPSSTVSVSSALTMPAVPTPSAAKLDVNQPLTVTDTIPSSGTTPYSWQWLVEVNGAGGYASATQCGASASGSGATGGALETCTIPGGTLTAGDSYTFELQVTDQSSSPETMTSSASATVTVSSALTAPGTPGPSAAKLDVNQALTVTGTVPSSGTLPYSWQWLIEVNGAGGYVAATECGSSASGSGAGAGAMETCTIPGGTLTAGDTYTFELQVTDSASTAVTATSAATSAVTVNTPLTAPSAPTISSNPVVDQGETSTLTATIPSTGTSTYSWQWLYSTNGGSSYTAATSSQCANPGASGATGGAVETCTFATTSSTPTGSYLFELKVTDSASTPEVATSLASAAVTVNSALTAPATPTSSATKLDVNQALTITDSTPSTGTPPYSWQWLVSIDSGGFSSATQCAVNSGSGAAGGALETCSIAAGALSAGANYAFELQVTDSATTHETTTSSASLTVTVSSALGAPAVPNVSATKLDSNQVLTMMGTIPSTGTSPYGWQWLIEVNGAGGYVAASQCGATASGSGAGAGALETCTIPAGTLTAGDVYSFEFKATDSASAPETATSTASSTVTVNAALTAPVAPTVSAAKLDVNQALTVTGTIPATGTSTYSWQWLISVNGGAYAAATQCSVNGGSGAAAGAPEVCSFAASTLTVGDSYALELEVTDSASTPETVTSTASSTVTVSAALTASTAPALSATKLDLNQVLTVTATLPSTGTSPYSWKWLISVDGGAFAATTQCAANSGSGGAGGAPESCSIAGGTLTAGDTYAFELQVTDSATVAESSTSAASASATTSSTLIAPSAPSLSATKLDVNQPLTVSGTISSTGTSLYSWQWLISINGGAYGSATQCTVNGGTGASGGALETCAVAASAFTAGDSYAFELRVTDNATTPESATSAPSSAVSVSTALGAPGAPTITSNSVVDRGQTSTLTATIPNSGMAPYSWQWLYSTNGGTSYSPATSAQCATPSGSGALGGATETCSFATTASTALGNDLFELAVTDGATTPETATSSASSAVTVNSALTAPPAPTPSATTLDADQNLTLTGTIPSTGTSLYSWQWLIEVNGAGGYVAATQCGASASGSGATSGATETCTVPGNTLTATTSYTFELRVSDSASSPETQTSPASSTVTTSSALTAGTPTPTSPAIDHGQSIDLTANPSGGTTPYSYQWYSGSTAIGCTGLGAPISGATSSTYSASPTSSTFYCYVVTDHASDTETSAAGQVRVNSALSVPSTPMVSAAALDADQTLMVTGTIPSTGTPSYSWQWLVSIGGGAFSDATQCAVNNGTGAAGGVLATCTIAGNSLSPGSTYVFELQVTDSATTPETATSTASSGVAVSASLTAPAAPNPSASKMDVNQVLTVSATLPSTGTSAYSWQWLISINGGAYADATQCAVSHGINANEGARELCTVPSGTLTAGDSYSFELRITDSATTPESASSAASGTVTVSTPLTTLIAPTTSATKLDVDQGLTVTGTLPSTGTPVYSWQWLISIDGAVYVDATECATNGGSGAAGGTVEMCDIAGSTLTAGDTYTFELEVTDSATAAESTLSTPSSAVAVSPPLAAGSASPASPAIDDGQSLLLSAEPSGGSGGDTYQWYSGSSARGCVALGSPIAGATSATFSASPTTSTFYCYVVTDSATVPESQTSSSSAVTVNSALTAPPVPTVSSEVVLADQTLTVTGTIPSTGTPPYSWQWLISTNGGAFADATQCAVNGGAGVNGGATVTCSVPAGTLTGGNTYAFELRVGDDATAPDPVTSMPSSTVKVTSPSAPSELWVYVGIVLAAIAAVVLVAIVAMRRRRPPAAVASPPPKAIWEE
ncbi:MAG: hypothetical protein WA691_05875 [Thermoplasmata archaeon]